MFLRVLVLLIERRRDKEGELSVCLSFSVLSCVYVSILLLLMTIFSSYCTETTVFGHELRSTNQEINLDETYGQRPSYS